MEKNESRDGYDLLKQLQNVFEKAMDWTTNHDKNAIVKETLKQEIESTGALWEGAKKKHEAYAAWQAGKVKLERDRVAIVSSRDNLKTCYGWTGEQVNPAMVSSRLSTLRMFNEDWRTDMKERFLSIKRSENDVHFYNSVWVPYYEKHNKIREDLDKALELWSPDTVNGHATSRIIRQEIETRQKQAIAIKTEMERLDDEIKKITKDQDELAQEINICRAYEIALDQKRESDYLTRWKEWLDEKDEIKRKMDLHVMYNRFKTVRKLREIGNERRELEKKKKELQNVKNALIGWDAYNTCKKELERQQKAKEEKQTEYAVKVKEAEKRKGQREAVDAMDRYYANLTGPLTLLNEVIEAFAFYKDWVLEQKIVPLIVKNVNVLLGYMCENHRPIELCAEMDSATKTFLWVFKDGGLMPPLEKASGFQKNMINLAMRIVLGKLGVSGMKNTQLFIDEGFTACDLHNLEHVPHVLNNILKVYPSIFIVSHLDDLKHSIRRSIEITRTQDQKGYGWSHIAFGEKKNLN